jgi:lipocalin
MKFLNTIGKLALSGLVIAGTVLSSTLANLCFEPQVVQDLNVSLYANNQSWYEVARTKDEFFENDLVCVHAQYTPKPDGHLAVFNQGRRLDPKGELFSIVGDAYPKNTSLPAKLTVKFPNIPWESPYWIIYVDDDYQRAIVYSCQDALEFGWILSRDPLVSTPELNDLISLAGKLGIKQEYFSPVLQLGC